MNVAKNVKLLSLRFWDLWHFKPLWMNQTLLRIWVKYLPYSGTVSKISRLQWQPEVSKMSPGRQLILSLNYSLLLCTISLLFYTGSKAILANPCCSESQKSTFINSLNQDLQHFTEISTDIRIGGFRKTRKNMNCVL